jgi:hypothetical protein
MKIESLSDKYIGEFKNGKRDGIGVLKRADGIEYHGYFRNDKEDIFGQFNLETNDIINGLVENGNLQGYSYSFNLSALSNITESYYNSSGESEPFDQSNSLHMQSRQKYDLLEGNYMNRKDKLRSEMELIDEKTGFKLFYME